MTRKRTIATLAALGGFTATMALLSGLPAARADELSDLRVNQELLQRRLDQLAQAPGPGNPFGVGGAPGPRTVQMMGGSFPRSFLIPGTDTSIRVGGEIRANALYFITGGAPNAISTNAGSTGQLNNIPLNGAQASRGHSTFQLSPQQSKVNFETRTPTAWGEARTFLEFDWAGNAAASQRVYAISSNLSDRLRYAYGTLGGLLFGQANSNFGDSDASTEIISFGGLVGDPAPARIAQIRYTMPLAGWGFPGALSVSAEQPETEIWTPGSTVAAPVINAAGAVVAGTTAVAGTGGVFGAFPTTAVPGNPLKTPAPDLTASWYIPQPWGHVDFGAVVRPTLQVKDGLFVDRNFVGYGFQFSGDVKPRWLGWDRDFITWHVSAGDGAGRSINAGSGNGTIGLVSNYTNNLAATALGATGIIVKPVRSYGGNVGYRHYWAPNLRSNIGIGFHHEDINTLRGAVCSGGSSAAQVAARNAGTAGCGLNKELINAAVNLIWNPIPFVDFGVEYMWGHRVTVSNAQADENVVLGRMRVQF